MTTRYSISPRSPHVSMSISASTSPYSPNQSQSPSRNYSYSDHHRHQVQHEYQNQHHDAQHIASELENLRILENSKKGRVKYDNGWDKNPHSFLKLVSDVQQQTDLKKNRVLERAYQITLKDKEKERQKQRELSRRSLGISSRFDLEDDVDNDSNNDNDNDSSCSSSTVNEFYNNDYYESASGSTSRSDTPQNQNQSHRSLHNQSQNQSQNSSPSHTFQKQNRHVHFLQETPLSSRTQTQTSPGIPIRSPSSGVVFPVRRISQSPGRDQEFDSPTQSTSISRSVIRQDTPIASVNTSHNSYRSRTTRQSSKNSGQDEDNKSSFSQTIACVLPHSPELMKHAKPVLGNILQRGYGCRDEDYNDNENARGFLQDSLVFTITEEALAQIDEHYREEAEKRISRRRHVYLIQKHQQQQLRVDIYPKQNQGQSPGQRVKSPDRFEQEKRIEQVISEGKRQMEALKMKQKFEREEADRLKLANEVERKKIHEEFAKRMEEAAAAAAAQEAQAKALAQAKAKENEERLAKEAEELRAKQKKEQEQDALKKAEEAAKRKAAISAADKSQGGYEVPPEFQGFILPTDLQRYLKSQQLLGDYKDKFAHITAKGQTKDYYCAALKAVNTPLNSIANSPDHIRSKVNTFVSLLQGKPVSLGEASNAGTFICGQQPDGELFVSNLLAFRFVKKSESEISKGHTSVEPLALLGVSIARQFPQWAVLVRANFFKMCPFLVPFSFPRNDLSVEDYALAMGHELRGSESAVRQALLDKMTGYCTLYALMVKIFERQKVTDIGEATQFFSLKEVWRILVTTMKLRPQLDMTATVIQILLDNLGDRLSSLYGLQFKKLIQVLLQTYLPQIRQETPAGKTAALTRLELFLEKKLQTGF